MATRDIRRLLTEATAPIQLTNIQRDAFIWTFEHASMSECERHLIYSLASRSYRGMYVHRSVSNGDNLSERLSYKKMIAHLSFRMPLASDVWAPPPPHNLASSGAWSTRISSCSARSTTLCDLSCSRTSKTHRPRIEHFLPKIVWAVEMA